MKVAHRGGSRVCMENTLEGFKDCVNNYKPDMLEMDVCFTKDRKLVVHHDSNLVRTCGLQDFIEHIEYDKLPNFQAKVPLDFAYRQYN
jgi:glycerophosphoryl diester phosphodiesterase